MKFFLHAGLPKTGSSAIQMQLAVYKIHIESYGVCMPTRDPKLLERLAKGAIASGNGQALHLALLSSSLDSVVELLRHGLDAPEGFKNFLYSCELLIPSLSTLERFKLLRKALIILGFSELKILLFVRNPASHALSWYGECIKQGKLTITIDEYLNNYNFPLKTANLVRLATDISDSELSVDIELRNYSTLKHSVIDAVWNWMNIPAPKQDVTLCKPVNRSLSLSESEFCRQLAIAGCKPGFLAKSLAIALPFVKPSYYNPTQDSLDKMYSRMLSSLQFLNSLLPSSEQLTLSAGDENIDTSSAATDEFTFSSEQLFHIAQQIAPYIKGDKRS
jgi:hypothetical protein